METFTIRTKKLIANAIVCAPGTGCTSAAQHQHDDSYQVRLSAVAIYLPPTVTGDRQPDYTEFYRNLFDHLDRELFREAQP